MSISTPRLILVDPQCQLCECWKQQFLGLSHVEIVNWRFEDLEECDCMVSAANSFGLMDGGVDLAITDYFGVELKYRVQKTIIRAYKPESARRKKGRTRGVRPEFERIARRSSNAGFKRKREVRRLWGVGQALVA
jgi:hypothetical protein